MSVSNCTNLVSATARHAFTLVEMLIVVVILGILATIAIPRVSDASSQAKDMSLRDDLRVIRTQVTVFKAQHGDVAPGYPAGVATATPTEAVLVDQLTKFTDDKCGVSATATATHRLGPYLTKSPVNPVNGKSNWLVVANGAAMPAPTGTYGWIYKPQTEELIPDLVGSDHSGKSYTTY
jgi:prepilin-type N-terminal cleavage/methylation domain-containing protein